MSKKFLTEHINQVLTHKKNSAEKKLAEQNALLATNPQNVQQTETPSLKEKLDHIVVQEQLVLKEKQAVTIRENEVYRFEQEAATKERMVREQLQKEKEQVEQQVIALRLEQEKIAKEKISLRLEQEQVLLRIQEQDAIEQEAFRERQQIREALELEREQLAREKMLLIAEQKKAEERINESIQELAVRNEEALRERQQNIAKMQEAFELNLERERIAKEQQVQQEERDQLARARVEQERIKEEINIPVQIAEHEPEDEDYYIVPLAGEDNN
jgi:hypothetical protein